MRDEKSIEYVQIYNPTEDDVKYVKSLFDKGKVREEDLRDNMKIIHAPDHSNDSIEPTRKARK